MANGSSRFVIILPTYRADLHIHTVLSPCGEVEMIPPLIVQACVQKGIQLIAITDHNASANVLPVQEAARSSNLTVLPGMEIQTLEEVHMLCLFDDLNQLFAWQKRVNASLPNLKNNPHYFGEQFIVDATGDLIACEEQLLLTSTSIPLEQAISEVHILGGLAIPAHVDRKSYSLFANLGVIPQGLAADAIEISPAISPERALQMFPDLHNYPLIQNGDAHCLDDIAGVCVYELNAPTIAEIKLALDHKEGRSVSISKS